MAEKTSSIKKSDIILHTPLLRGRQSYRVRATCAPPLTTLLSIDRIWRNFTRVSYQWNVYNVQSFIKTTQRLQKIRSFIRTSRRVMEISVSLSARGPANLMVLFTLFCPSTQALVWNSSHSTVTFFRILSVRYFIIINHSVIRNLRGRRLQTYHK